MVFHVERWPRRSVRRPWRVDLVDPPRYVARVQGTYATEAAALARAQRLVNNLGLAAKVYDRECPEHVTNLRPLELVAA